MVMRSNVRSASRWWWACGLLAVAACHQQEGLPTAPPDDPPRAVDPVAPPSAGASATRSPSPAPPLRERPPLAESYLPLKVGARWVYRMSYPGNPAIVPTIKTTTVEAFEPIGGVKGALMAYRVRTHDLLDPLARQPGRDDRDSGQGEGPAYLLRAAALLDEAGLEVPVGPQAARSGGRLPPLHDEHGRADGQRLADGHGGALARGELAVAQVGAIGAVQVLHLHGRSHVELGMAPRGQRVDDPHVRALIAPHQQEPGGRQHLGAREGGPHDQQIKGRPLVLDRFASRLRNCRRRHRASSISAFGAGSNPGPGSALTMLCDSCGSVVRGCCPLLSRPYPFLSEASHCGRWRRRQPKERIMKCEELMKREVHSVKREDTVQWAASCLRDANIGFLPVCDAAGKVVGTLTDRDIAIRLAADDRSAAGCTVGEIMSAEVVSCHPGDDLAEAERLMATCKKSRIVITDDAGVLCGVISLSDVAELDTPKRAAITLRNVADREARAT